MAKVSPETTPVAWSLASPIFEQAAFGDGELLAMLIEFFKEILPTIMACFPAKAAFAQTAKDPDDYDLRSLKIMGRRWARRNRVAFRDRGMVAENGARLLVQAGDSATIENLEAAYDEVTKQ